MGVLAIYNKLIPIDDGSRRLQEQPWSNASQLRDAGCQHAWTGEGAGHSSTSPRDPLSTIPLEAVARLATQLSRQQRGHSDPRSADTKILGTQKVKAA